MSRRLPGQSERGIFAGNLPAKYVGLGSSNAPVRVDSAQPKQVLNIKIDDSPSPGCDAMATIHFTARPLIEDPALIPTPSNSQLVIEVAWQSGNGGGSCLVDGTHGMKMCVAATEGVVANAFLVSAVEGVALAVGTGYELEAVVKWGTSGGEGPARISLPGRATDPDTGDTDWIRIPNLARNITGHLLDATGYASLVGSLATSPNAADIRYRTLIAPQKYSIVAGVEFVRWRCSVANVVTTEFELWA